MSSEFYRSGRQSSRFSGQSLKILICFVGTVLCSCGSKETSAQKRIDRAHRLPRKIFSRTAILESRITSPKACSPKGPIGNLAAEQAPDREGNVEEGDHVYTNVAIHLKGAAGSW
jgi:hypothetical protein